MKLEWVVLVYKIPPHPTRLRAQVWRNLQRCGAIYLQNSVSIVPATSELAENMQWIADEIREMGGEALLFRATPTSPAQEGQIERLFGAASRAEARKLLEALGGVERRLRRTAAADALAEVEEDLRRLRQAALKLRLRSHFPAPEEEVLHRRLRALRDRVDRDLARAFTAAGVSHVVAISGWNIAIVAAAVATVAGRLGRHLAHLQRLPAGKPFQARNGRARLSGRHRAHARR